MSPVLELCVVKRLNHQHVRHLIAGFGLRSQISFLMHCGRAGIAEIGAVHSPA